MSYPGKANGVSGLALNVRSARSTTRKISSTSAPASCARNLGCASSTLMAFMFIASLALHALLLYSAYQCAPAEVVSQGFRSVSFRAHKGDRLLQPAPATAKSVTDAGAEQAAKVADRTTTSRGRGIVDLDASGLAFTQQTCYMDTDESEQCVYDDAICFDGTHPVMLVGHTPRVNAVIDSLNDCMDYRYLEPSIYEFGECKYATSGERFYKPEDHPEDLKHDSGIISRVRYWGPPNRHQVFFSERSATDVFGPNGHYDGLDVLEPRPFAHESVSGLQVQRRMRNAASNLTIDWVNGGLWLLALPGQSWANPYHWLSAMVSPLYAARRNNASGPWGANPADGYMHGNGAKADVVGPPGTVPSVWREGAPGKNRVSFRMGAQWDLPSMDTVVGIGDSGREIETRHDLLSWFAGTLASAVPSHSNVYFNDLMSAYSPNKLLCAPRGVVPSLKPRMFTGWSDAWVWRQRMHLAVGLDPSIFRSHPRLPPRFITVVDRSGLHGRGIFNNYVLQQAVEATGLPYRILPKLDELTFKEQVELMAGTGILIAPHGAHLANLAFMPARSAVIELFPPLMKKNTYRNLAGAFGVHYFPVFSRHLLPPNVTKDYYGQEIMTFPEFRDECIMTNVSCYESLTQSHCNWASKTYAILVPRRQFTETLRDALDAIGAYSLLNPAWKHIVERDNIPPPDHLQWFDNWDDTIE